VVEFAVKISNFLVLDLLVTVTQKTLSLISRQFGVVVILFFPTRVGDFSLIY
jgi:hypothetical protein